MDEATGQGGKHLGPSTGAGYLRAVSGESVAPVQEQPGPTEGLPVVSRRRGLEILEHGDSFMSRQPGCGEHGGDVGVDPFSDLAAGLGPCLQWLGHVDLLARKAPASSARVTPSTSSAQYC